jgi:hypothetical protein
MILTLDGQDFVPGRIVRYVCAKGAIYPMITIRTRKASSGADHRIDGVMFSEAGALYVGDVPYDQRRSCGSWHWPAHRTKRKTPAPAKPVAGKPIYTPKRGARHDKAENIPSN